MSDIDSMTMSAPAPEVELEVAKPTNGLGRKEPNDDHYRFSLAIQFFSLWRGAGEPLSFCELLNASGITHIWGSRRFSTRDTSTNNWFVALLTFGEGWHNNHHAHPTSSRHGLKWYEIDMNWYGIWALKMLGLAQQIKTVRLSTAMSVAN